MRAGLMPVIVIVTALISVGPSRSEEPRLADKTPDGAQLIDLYKAARTVADVEAANGKVKDEVLTVQSVASDLARLHVAKMTACEDVEAIAPRSDRRQGARPSPSLSRELMASSQGRSPQCARSSRPSDRPRPGRRTM